jgi:hypothetical protein
MVLRAGTLVPSSRITVVLLRGWLRAGHGRRVRSPPTIFDRWGCVWLYAECRGEARRGEQKEVLVVEVCRGKGGKMLGVCRCTWQDAACRDELKEVLIVEVCRGKGGKMLGSVKVYVARCGVSRRAERGTGC